MEKMIELSLKFKGNIEGFLVEETWQAFQEELRAETTHTGLKLLDVKRDDEVNVRFEIKEGAEQDIVAEFARKVAALGFYRGGFLITSCEIRVQGDVPSSFSTILIECKATSKNSWDEEI